MAIRIYIDEGHNPQNPNAGAEGNGLREQDVVFRVGMLLTDLLEANGAFSVRNSRPTPSTQLGDSTGESLALRVQDANTWGADYFISLHTNASEYSSATGVEGFAYRTPSRACTLGSYLLQGVSRETGLRNRGMFSRPGLYVLRRTVMPAVLVELGFITNPRDAALMRDRPDLFAEGLYRGILEYLKT